MYFRAIFKVNIQNEDIFWGCKNFKYFWMLDIPDIFGGRQ